MVTEQLPILRLIDVIAAWETRGEQDKADYYRLIYVPYVSIYYGLSEEMVLHISIDELSKLPVVPQEPLKYEGWDTFIFGRCAFA